MKKQEKNLIETDLEFRERIELGDKNLNHHKSYTRMLRTTWI